MHTLSSTKTSQEERRGNAIWLYRLYEMAEEFNLESVEETLMREKPTSRVRLHRVSPKSIVIENPPVEVDMGHITLPQPPWELDCTIVAKIHSLGVVSIILRIALPEKMTYEQLRELAVTIYASDGIDEMAESQLAWIKRVLAGAYVPSAKNSFVEDFTVFFFSRWDRSWDPVPLLLAEREELSPQLTEETLKNSFCYGREDLTIITWDAALVYDPDLSTDVPDLLEFALTQLLELRYYDGLLSEELSRMYDEIKSAGAFWWYSRLNRYRRISKKLMEMVADVTDITEKLQNSIKVTEDIFYARVYGAALAIFRTHTWDKSINDKLSVLRNTYSMLTMEIENARIMQVEVAIVLLILIEIILGLLKLF